MVADTLIRNRGMEALSERLGMVDAERFIMIVQRESFDYTKWQENLFEDMSLEEISEKAAALRLSNENMGKQS